jgi:polyhydroxyalkanoate synthase
VRDVLQLPWRLAGAMTEASLELAGRPNPMTPPPLAQTPREVVRRDGTAQLYRFHGDGPTSGAPLLVVPSIINRWYVVDLRPGSSLVEALVASGRDVWCIDWGAPEDEDRHLSWDDLLARLSRLARVVRRETKQKKIGLLGYCMGATLCAIHAALEPETVAVLVDLLGPIDFSAAGDLARATDPRWFDVDAMVEAGNISPEQMQAGFTALRPTNQLAKWVGFFDRAVKDEVAREAFLALEAWAGDNIAFPAEAYRTYIRDLYQRNALIEGEHRVNGRKVDLARIDCPILAIVASRDAICPAAAAEALIPLSSSKDTEVLAVPGGHVGAVVGSKARSILYPRLCAWLAPRLAPPPSRARPIVVPS